MALPSSSPRFSLSSRSQLLSPVPPFSRRSLSIDRVRCGTNFLPFFLEIGAWLRKYPTTQPPAAAQTWVRHAPVQMVGSVVERFATLLAVAIALTAGQNCPKVSSCSDIPCVGRGSCNQSSINGVVTVTYRCRPPSPCLFTPSSCMCSTCNTTHNAATVTQATHIYTHAHYTGTRVHRSSVSLKPNCTKQQLF